MLTRKQTKRYDKGKKCIGVKVNYIDCEQYV